MHFAPEAVVFKEGDEGQCMYFVAKGQIELSIMLVV
jgi:CRP-like cAMP-binding protein